MSDIDSMLPIRTLAGVGGVTGPADVVVGLFDASDVRISPLTMSGFTAGMVAQTAGLTASIENQTAGLTAQMVSDTAGVTGALATQTAGLTAQMVTDTAGVTLAISEQTAGLTAQMVTDTAGVTGAIATQTAGLTAQMVTDTAGITGALATQTSGLTAAMATQTAGITGAIQSVSDQLPSVIGATAMADSLSVTIATNQSPMPVYITDQQSAVQVNQYKAEDKAYLSASTNSYAPASLFKLDRVWASGSGRIKVEVVVAGATAWAGFNSASNPNVEIDCSDTPVTSAQQVDLIVTNIETGKTQTLYSTIVGNL